MINIALVLISFFFMEFVAWFSHKYVMHGFLWEWHKDHHVNDHRNRSDDIVQEKVFEKNDRFFLIYALPAIVLIITGVSFNYPRLIFIGGGISLYGLTYFTIHDVIIHRRIRIPFLQNKHNFYIRAVVKAHATHHWARTMDDFKNFGLLVFPSRFFNQP